jgi:hypothetical protein
VRNLATLGLLARCGPGGDGCAALGLECDASTGLCDAPTVGYGQACAPGFRRCRTEPLTDDERAIAPLGYLCHPREPRGFCLIRCDASQPNTTGSDAIDSRCGEEAGLVCSTPGVSSAIKDDRRQSVCIRRCSGASTPEQNARICGPSMICINQRAITGCNFDDTLEPR